MSPARPGSKVNTDEPWAKEAGKYFDSSVNSLPLPVRNFFFSESARVLYSPIPKVACTSLKSLMVELSGVPAAEKILEYGVHRATDIFATGAQLKDIDQDHAEEILGDKTFYKFAVIREPVGRIVSAYTEKFFLNRLNKRNQFHTLDIVRSLRLESTPDLHSGISFRSFVQYLTRSTPDQVDAHWKPQVSFLAGVDRYNAIFTLEQLDELAKQLSALCHRDITLGKHNTGIGAATGQVDSPPGRYADLLPAELDNMENVVPRDFMADNLVAQLEAHFHEDVALYRSAQSGNNAYTPPAVPVRNSTAKERPALFTAAEIANWVSLYCKGFFTLNEAGQGQLGVMLTNSGEQSLDFSALPACALQYTACDDAGNALHPPQTQTIGPGTLAASKMSAQTLNIEMSPQLAQATHMIKVSLLFGKAFVVEDLWPLHVTSAQLVAPPKA